MQSITRLIAFAAGGNADPITPAFDPRLAIREVILLHNSAETQRADWLAEVLRDGGKAVRKQTIPNLSQFATLRSTLSHLLAEHSGTALNISGTDAARAALALQAAHGASLPVCVVEPETDRLHWLAGPSHFSGFDIADRITLGGYLAAHGYDCVASGAFLGDPADALDDIARYLAELAFSSPKVVENFRRAMTLQGDVTTHAADRGAIRNIADYLRVRGLVEILPNKRLRIAQPEHRAFLGGGWLERWLFRLVLDIAGPGRLQDAARGLKIATATGVENEFDVAVLRDNALYFAECKGFARPGIGNETLFKLHSLSEQRGLKARSLVLSTRQPTDSEALRADNLSIVVIGGASLSEVRGRVADWLMLP